MTNSKQTKKALLSSVIALILCLSMLIGTTFAWFTDSVSSDWNEIKAGNLDIELYYGKGEPTKKVESTTKDLFTDANGEAILWEPGVVAYTNLKVANEGTLALKYQLAVNFQNENATTDGYSLSQVLKVGVVEGGVKNTDRDLVVKEVKTEDWQNLAVFQKTGSLMAKGVEGAAKTYGIVIWWEPSAEDNNWNLNNGRQTTDGKDYLHIDLGVKLIATQFTYEQDSFDHLYDEGANATDVINGVTYLYDGTDIVLYDAADYTEEDLVIPEGVTKIGKSAFAGNTTLETVVLPSTVAEVDDYAFSQSAIENVVLNDGLKTIGDRAFQKMPNMTSIKIPSTVETIQEYAFQGSKLQTLVIPASVTRIDQAAFAYNTALETIIIEGSPVIGDSVNAGNKGLNYVARGCANLKTVMLLGDDIEFATKGITFANTEGGLVTNITFYVANETVKAKLIDATSELKNKQDKVVVLTTKGEGLYTDGKTYFVYTAAGLTSLNQFFQANSMANATWGKTYNILADIDASDVTWNSVYMIVGNNDNDGFVLEGNGHTITGMTINGSMFAGTPNGGNDTEPGYVKNLTFDGVKVLSNDHWAAVLWGNICNELVIENVHIRNSEITGNCNVAAFVGGTIIDGNPDVVVDFKNCSVENTTITAKNTFSGIVGDWASDPTGASVYVGRVFGNSFVTFEDCTANNNTVINGEGLTGGGIYGYTSIVNGWWAGTGVCNTFTNWAGSPVHEYSEEDGSLWDVIKNLKSGDVLVIPGGTYVTTGKYQVPAGVTIMGKAGETVVFHQASAAQDDVFNCEGDVTFCNVTIESNRKGYAITYKNQDHVCDGDITVINCKFIGLAADKNYGIYKNLNGNLTVMNCTFENYNNAICGVNNQNGSTTVVTGCTFTNINGEAIGYVISSVPADFEANAIANNTGLTADNVIGH